MSEAWAPGFDLRWCRFDASEFRQTSIATEAGRLRARQDLGVVLQQLSKRAPSTELELQIPTELGDFGVGGNSRDALLQLIEDAIEDPADYSFGPIDKIITSNKKGATQPGLTELLVERFRSDSVEFSFSAITNRLLDAVEVSNEDEIVSARADVRGLARQWVPKIRPVHAEILLGLVYFYAADREVALGSLLKELVQDPDAPQWLRHRAKGEWYYDEDGNTIYGVEPK